jgi:hypothetical protein
MTRGSASINFFTHPTQMDKFRSLAGILVCVGCLTGVLSACETSPIPLPGENPATLPSMVSNTPASFATGTSEVAPTVTTLLTATETPIAPTRPQVTIRADLDYSGHRLTAKEIIAYPNRTGEALTHITFDVLAARRKDIFTLLSGSIHNDSASVFTVDGTKLRVDFTKPLAADAVATIEIEYALHLPPILPQGNGDTGALGWSAHQINLGDWFAAVSAYRDGWYADRNMPAAVGETTTPEAADYYVDLGLTNAPTGTQIMASAAAEMVEGRYRYELRGARSFALSLSTEWEISEVKTSTGVSVRSAYLRDHEMAGWAAMQAAADALVIFAEKFGPYRYTQLTLVEAGFSDGMEYSGFFFMGSDFYPGYDNTSRNYLTAIAVHETAHQWWYGDVGNDQAREPWLDEALSAYSELIYYQASQPEAVNWWWDYRVQRFYPKGWVNSTVYDLPQFRPYVNAVYLRGALFLDDLRAAMGDEAFFSFLRQYHSTESGRVASAVEFWSLLPPYDVPGLQGLKGKYFRP